jgi:hypothetical protein
MMRAFLAACVVVVVIAAGAGVGLDLFVQQDASAAFAVPGVRN